MNYPLSPENEEALSALAGRGPEFVPPKSSDYVREVGELFRVGKTENTMDLSLGPGGQDGRVFAWHRQPNDFEAAKYMGWYEYMQRPYQGLDTRVMEKIDNMSHMMIPGDMRNANSLLGGKKAWDTEKIEIFETVATRLGSYWQQTGRYPSEFSWDTVGITTKDEREIVILPPHGFEVIEGADQILAANGQIVDRFRKLLSEPSNYHAANLENFNEKFMKINE